MIETPALTALFIGMAWALIKVVEFFISKYKKGKESQGLTEKQEEMLKEAADYSKNLFEMHNVYDESRIPLWIFPPEISKLVRETHNSLEMLTKELEDSVDNMKYDQSIVVNKITDLVTSQKLMTERLGDLIAALKKFPNGG